MENPSVHNNEGHETKEVSVPFVFASLTALIIGAFLSALLAVGIFQFFKSTYHPDQSAKQAVQQIPPEPRLQVHAPEDLRTFREREDHILSTYAIIDQKQGTVRVPIDRAIDMLGQKGLPTHNYLDDILAGRKPPVAAPPEAQRRTQGSNNAQ
jgi:hypothetical protein